MKHETVKRSIAFLLTLMVLLGCFPAPAMAGERTTEAASAETRAETRSALAQDAADLKTRIQGLASGGEHNARVNLTGFAPTTDEGDPIFGLRGQYYVAYLQDDTTAMVLDGSWGNASNLHTEENPISGKLPSVSVPVDEDSLNTASLGKDIAFTLLPADMKNKTGRHVFAFANQTLSASGEKVYQMGATNKNVCVLNATSISGAPRILTRRLPGENKMDLRYSFSGGAVYALCTASTDTTPSFGWDNKATGTPMVLYHRWSTVSLRTAIGNAATLLGNPDSYVAAEYANFLTCLEKSIATFNIYNGFSGMIAPYVYPQEEMDRLTHELESYRTLLSQKNYIDIPVEIIDFRSDGYLFENTAYYAFRFDKGDLEVPELGDAIHKEIRDRFMELPDLPGELKDPNSVSSPNNMRVGLTEQSLVNGKLVYHPDTITYMAHLMCKKESNNSSGISYYVPGLPGTLHEHIHKTFFKPYTASTATEADKEEILGSWTQTLAKIGGANGNPMTWSQVETAHDAAYYLLTYLWQSVPETDTFHYDGSPASLDLNVVDPTDNRYNKTVTQRDTLRLYGNNGVYTLDANKEMGYSGRYAFNTSTNSALILPSKPRFAPIDGLGFEEPGVMKNLYDTDPGSGRVVIEGHNGYDSNYNFSMHASGSFVYYEDQNLFFEFNGDDDVYFFINGDLALDIGSSHAAKRGKCILNTFRDKNGNPLVDGETYTFDMFYTERATPDSNLMFSTNIKIVDDKALTTKSQYLEKHGIENHKNSETGFGDEREENALVAIGDTIAYSFELLNTRTVPLTDVSFSDDTLGVAISKDSLTLYDPSKTNGAKTEITDIVVAYRTYDAVAGVNGTDFTMVSYDTMESRIREATTEPTGEADQFVQLDPGSYGVKISSESELKTLLELGIPVNCQMIVYGFKRIMITTDQPYRNIVQSIAHYKRVSVEGTGLVYGDPIPVSGTAERTIRVLEPGSIAAPTAEAERYVIDYNKPVVLSLDDITKHVYSNKMVSVGNILGFVAEGGNGSVLRRVPTTLYCEKGQGGRTLKTANGTVKRNGDELTYTLDGFLSGIDKFYAVVEIGGLYAQSDGQEYSYPCILVEIQIIPASTMYYETDLAAKEFTNEAPTRGLFFDFKNDPADQKRYADPVYGNANFDDTETVHWTGSVEKTQISNAGEGTLVVDARYVAATEAHPGFSLDASVKGNKRDHLLNYKVAEGDVLQVRLKMENFISKGGAPYLSLHPTYDGTKVIDNDTKSRKDFEQASYVSDGEYHIVTSTLTDENFSYTTLNGLRIYFGNINSQSDDVRGKLTIDYIYVGPLDMAPIGEHLYFDFTDRETDRDRYGAKLYGSGNFYNYDVGTWRHRSSTLRSISFDATGEGKFVLTTMDNNTLHSLDANGNPLYTDGKLADLNNEAWIQASPNPKTNLNMNYHPKEGDVLLIGLRMENITGATGKTFGVRPAFHSKRTEDVSADLYSLGNPAWPDGITDGNYKQVEIKLWEHNNYLKQSLLTSFRLTFTGLALKDPSLGSGKIEIDYIFIGQKEDFPKMEKLYGQTWQTVTDGTNHTGEVQETDFVNRTVYDMEACGDDKRFFIGFDNTDKDVTRYSSATYGNKNWDMSSTWPTCSSTSLKGNCIQNEVQENAGLYVLTARASYPETEFPCVFQDLAGLDMNLPEAEVFQIRFKAENFVLGEYYKDGENKTFAQPYVDLHYLYDGITTHAKIAGDNWVKNYDVDYLTGGQFVTVTLDLTDEFRNAEKIHTLRPYFGGIESPTDGSNGILSIDYIYIGPRDRAPAETVYGYDRSYDDDTMLSNGSSVYVEGAGVRVNGTESEYTETLFSFTGTGFDIISRTGAQQATIRVSVFDNPERSGDPIKTLTVNNKGELELNQIPVVSIQGLTHGTHYVTIGVNKKITGSAYEFLNRGNQFYFDAIRIYDPMDITGNTELQKVYKLDKELDPRVKEVRNILLTSSEFKDLMGSTEGAVFIDSYQKETVVVPDPETGKPETVEDPDISINDHYALSVQTYNKVGPKNEVYLSPGQAVAFRLKMHSSAVPVSLDIGAKTINGTATELVTGIVTASADMESVLTVETATRKDLTTATAMYYPLAITDSMISNDRYCYIVIMNGDDSTDPRNGDHVLSITDIKVCYSNVLTQQLPEDGSGDPEIHKRTVTEEEPISFLVDGNTARAAAFFLGKELSLPLEKSNTELFHSLDLASSIALNYAVAKTELAEATDIYLEVRLPRYSGNSLTGTEVRKLQPELKGNYYYFTLEGLTAVAMNDIMEATLFYTRDGICYATERDTYSIAQYAHAQLNKNGAPDILKQLCADLLRYGAKAQVYKNYRTDALVDSTMTESHRAYLSDIESVTFGNTNVTLNDLDNAPIAWAGKALSLESKVALRFMFKPGSYTGSLSELTLRVSYEDIGGNPKTVTVGQPEVYSENMGIYVFTVDHLLAAELRSVVSVQVCNGDTPVSCTLQYSADTYGNNKTGTLLDLCKALFAYSDSAKAYFA
ncbi:MAG: fibro-slime domain-containing protein [Oscillospiraceae bacterium]|nr:fibro-slime domain-containing protein [Oscillospiraceae bacterium]